MHGGLVVELRDEVIRSLKLNRDLSKLLEQALELDRTIKIGWTRDGEPLPKKDEMGISPALPKKGRIRLLGDLEDMVCILCGEGTFTLEGSAQDFFGAWNSGGNLIVERDVGNYLGYKMNSGKITVRDGAGDSVGSGISGGLVIVRGDAGEKVGEIMSGGTIIIHGDVGRDSGLGMTGGRIIVNGRCPKVGNGAKITTLSKDDVDKINKEIEDESLQIPGDVICLVTESTDIQNIIAPNSQCTGDWTQIGITPAEDDRGKIIADTVDTVVLLGDREFPEDLPERKKLGLSIPHINSTNSGKSNSKNGMRIVQSNPKQNDLLQVNTNNISSKIKWMNNCDGLVFDISDIPNMSAKIIDGLIVALRSIQKQEKLLLISGGIERVEKLHHMLSMHDLDGCIVDLMSSTRAHVSSALPRIGRSINSNGIKGNRQPTIVKLHWDITAKDVIICVASGSQIVCSQESESDGWLEKISAEIKGHLVEIGIDSIDKLSRKNLRALDYETAAISGLRLIGYDRPLPHWFNN